VFLCFSGGDDTNGFRFRFCKTDKQNTVSVKPDGNKSVLVQIAMPFIVILLPLPITKNMSGLNKTYAVLFNIMRIFVLVLLKIHAATL
jgi:hypothetical protein